MFGVEIDLTQWLGDNEKRQQVLGTIQAFQRRSLGFDFSISESVQSSLSDAIQDVDGSFREFKEVSEAPEAWSAVKKLLLDAFVSAFLEHLPRTVQALWLELSRNMMPAPWQYPGEARFNVEHRRGQSEVRIVVRGEESSPLARHILNGAEVLNLALSWFLVRYLTSGRFRYEFLVLDDPAQQMDQPTFRDFCRLLERLLRLHRIYSIPLTLVVLLHQDERALDAARVTNGTLHLLRWNRGTPALMRSTRIRSEMIMPPAAYSILSEY